MRKPLRPHWYRIYIGECPVCGRDSSYRERVYCDVEPRPADPAERYRYLPDTATYCGCLL